jgi:hypothetical protein
MALEKATIQAMTPPQAMMPEGKKLGPPIPVLFNPAEYTLEKMNSYGAEYTHRSGAPILQFTNGESEMLTMQLFFDTYTDQGGIDVRIYTDKVRNLLKIDPRLNPPAPPICLFQWGRFTFKAVLVRVSQKFTMFLSDGTPVRATLDVSFREYKTQAEQALDPPPESPSPTKQWLVKAGESLSAIAAQVYNNPTLWRGIALANKISNPRTLIPGSSLDIPRLR